MSLYCTVLTFGVIRNGYWSEVSINEHFDSREPLSEQTIQAANAWISRQLRIYGNRYALTRIQSVVIETTKGWRIENSIEGKLLTWPCELKDK